MGSAQDYLLGYSVYRIHSSSATKLMNVEGENGTGPFFKAMSLLFFVANQCDHLANVLRCNFLLQSYCYHRFSFRHHSLSLSFTSMYFFVSSTTNHVAAQLNPVDRSRSRSGRVECQVEEQDLFWRFNRRPKE